MSPGRPLPAGTKRRILDLLVREELTAAEIASRLDLSGAAVRQHLEPLRSAGVVAWEKETGTPGRPAWRYRLTPRGRRAYPKRYDVLVRELIEVLLERHGREAALELVAGAARRVALRAGAELSRGDESARWDRTLTWLEETFAWEAEVEQEPDDGWRIVLHQCPFQDLSAEHPEVCGTFFSTLIETLGVDGAPVHVPIRDGFRCCALERRREA